MLHHQCHGQQTQLLLENTRMDISLRAPDPASNLLKLPFLVTELNGSYEAGHFGWLGSSGSRKSGSRRMFATLGTVVGGPQFV